MALFNLDSVATNQPISSFIHRHCKEIVFVGLSLPFRAERGGFLRQSLRHVLESGFQFSNFLACDFILPRAACAIRTHVPAVRGERRPTIVQLCEANAVEARRIADVNAPEVIATLRQLEVDLIVSCFFDQIFKRELLDLPRLGAVNIHTSMLPLHRGPMPVINSWLDEPPTLGVSVHAIEDGIDTGPILAQEAYRPAASESVLQTMTVLHRRGLELLSDLLPALADGSVRGQAQTGGSYESFPTRAVIRQLRRRGVRLVNWNDMVRALGASVEI